MTNDPSNPHFRALTEYCSAKPLAVEEHPWGETVFKVGGKGFAFMGGRGGTAVTVKAAPDELAGLLTLSFVKRSAYVGRFGWVTVTIENDDALDVALRLIDRSYDLIAAKLPKKKRKAPASPAEQRRGAARGKGKKDSR